MTTTRTVYMRMWLGMGVSVLMPVIVRMAVIV